MKPFRQFMLTFGSGLTLTLISLAPASAAIPQCAGQDATIYIQRGAIVGGPDDGTAYVPGVTILRGTAGNDILRGTAQGDLIDGMEGDDLICGAGGDDVLFGGPGNDDLRGQAGADELFGDAGDDILRGGAGDDELNGGPGTNTLIGGADIDICVTDAVLQGCEVIENPLLQVGSLKSVTPPLPDLTGIVRNEMMAKALGKALFWDQQVGSDGQACASCHFHAGADSRRTNQLNPGLLDMRDVDMNGEAGDQTFGALVSDLLDPDDASPAYTAGETASGTLADSNITLIPEDFPFHQLENPLDRNSAILYTTNDVASSPGTFAGKFISVEPRNPADICAEANPAIFHAGGYAARKVEPRNTPTTINAVFNFRNFWDGRANNIFNGVDPFGRRNPNASILEWTPSGVVSKTIELENASLASQAVGPALSDFEMACAMKSFMHVGQKLRTLRPLALQQVHANDSLLKGFRHPSGQGLTFTYDRLIKYAFDPKYWRATETFDGFTQLEHNFSFFWGISIMLYESTLISDDSPFDRHFDGTELFAPDSAELRGLNVFLNKGKCINCHSGPEFSKAAIHLQAENQEEGLVERMAMGDGGAALYDNGFYNIGVTPTVQDIGLGGTGPFGTPLSFTRQYLDMLRGQNVPDRFEVDPCTFELPFGPDCSVEPTDPNAIDALRVAVDGAFKTPILRNIGLTPPYFHNGGYATLEQVVDFYNRGGNRRGNFPDDTTGTGPLGQGDTSGRSGSNLDPDIRVLNLTEQDRADLVAFMLSLTDERVACEQAPFDHPELIISHGHAEVDSDNDGRADDIKVVKVATGADGLQQEGRPCIPNTGDMFDMQTFEPLP